MTLGEGDTLMFLGGLEHLKTGTTSLNSVLEIIVADLIAKIAPSL